MSILIKGMEMPKPGAYICELGVLDKNTAVLTFYTSIDEPQRSYKIVFIPPHGELVERKAVLNTFSTHMNRTMHYVTIRDTVPTIIEAEEEK